MKRIFSLYKGILNSSYFETKLNDYLWEVYKPSPFNVENRDQLIAFCKKHSFGTVISNGASSVPVITHLPFVLREEGTQVFVEFHVARENKHWKLFAESKVGISVMGEHGYISSTVYHHVNVPTYNYESVYITGQASLLNTKELLQHLEDLVNVFENGRSKPLDFSGLPEEMMNAYLKEIVGIRVQVETIEGAFKLSQNRNTKDFHSITQDLEERNETGLAESMKNQYPTHE